VECEWGFGIEALRGPGANRGGRVEDYPVAAGCRVCRGEKCPAVTIRRAACDLAPLPGLRLDRKHDRHAARRLPPRGIEHVSRDGAHEESRQSTADSR